MVKLKSILQISKCPIVLHTEPLQSAIRRVESSMLLSVILHSARQFFKSQLVLHIKGYGLNWIQEKIQISKFPLVLHPKNTFESVRTCGIFVLWNIFNLYRNISVLSISSGPVFTKLFRIGITIRFKVRNSFTVDFLWNLL